MKPQIFKHDGAWWLTVPGTLLLGFERGVYHRRTFGEVVKMLDFYLRRGHRPRLVAR